MKKQELLRYTEELSSRICQAHGCRLWDVDYVKEGYNWYLKVYADKPSGISINDCVDISRDLEAELDKEDPFDNPYILEVSSPGLDRPLKKDRDFENSIGRQVDVKLYAEHEGIKGKSFTARLTSYDAAAGTVGLETEEGIGIVLQKKEIAGIRLAVIF